MREKILNKIARIIIATDNFKEEKWKDFFIGHFHISEYPFNGCPTDDLLFDIFIEIANYHWNYDWICNKP